MIYDYNVICALDFCGKHEFIVKCGELAMGFLYFIIYSRSRYQSLYNVDIFRLQPSSVRPVDVFKPYIIPRYQPGLH